MGRKTKIQMGNKMKEEIEKTSTFKQNQEMCKWYFEQGKSQVQAETQKKVEELLKRKFITNQGSEVVAVYSVNGIFNPKSEVKK